ncbi:hypothetical protein J3459_007478 [Metarhizium acridum]|nr:hypothetical protein J3459_007478 [Metarhizium acridum]
MVRPKLKLMTLQIPLTLLTSEEESDDKATAKPTLLTLKKIADDSDDSNETMPKSLTSPKTKTEDASASKKRQG